MTAGKKILRAITIVIAALAVIILVVALGFSDALLNRYAKGRIEAAFAEAYPGYVLKLGSLHYNLFKNFSEGRTVSLLASDSSLRAGAHSLSISGIGWHELVIQRGITPDAVKSSVLSADDVLIHLARSKLDIRCGHLQISAADSAFAIADASVEFAASRYHLSSPMIRADARDSLLTAEAIVLRPIAGDDDFFAASSYRRTRAALKIRKLSLQGTPVLDLLEGKAMLARSLECDAPEISLLVNRDKLGAPDTEAPLMPAEALAALGSSIRLDSLVVRDARLEYGERVDAQGKPGVITFDSVQLSASDIENAPRHTIAIEAKGRFMHGGIMSVSMRIPMTPHELSFRYHGALTAMDVTALNRFLETAEHTRISRGTLREASFDVRVERGRASGSVRMLYDDLYVTMLDPETGSGKAVGERLATTLANLVKIRGSNTEDRLKIGTVKYVRRHSDTFMNVAWFSLRSGVGSVVGF